LLVTLFAAPTSAFAQMIEIGPDGAVSHHGWPARAAEPAATASASSCNQDLRATFEEAARRYDVSVELLEAVAQTESNCSAEAVSPAGALGVMQLMPGTARQLGVDARDPAENIMGGAAYLREQIDRFGGRLDLALAAYNAGPAAVERRNAASAFPETRTYIARNLDRLADQSLSQTRTTP
jgi:soluble lytic murein transglycosylase-like protein